MRICPGWLLSLVLAACVSAQEVKHVVLVSIDGLAASYFDDPRAQMPTLRMLAKQGVRAKGMITTFPSVTWPSHVSLVTGCTARRHGVIGNNVWNRTAGRELVYIGDPELQKDQAIRVPTLYDAAHAAGLKCGGVIWPCSNGAKSLDWVIPDSNKQSLHDSFTTPGFAAELKESGIDIGPLGAWGWDKSRSRERDDLYARVALHLLQKHQANLILLHLITPDGVEHAFGPHTPEAYQAVAEADAHLKRIWDALQQPPFAGRAALVVTSDHGFAPVEKLIRPNVELKRLGLIKTDDTAKPLERKAWCVAQGGSAFIYVLDDGVRRDQLPGIRNALGSLAGVTRVIEPAEFAALGLPRPEDNPEAPDLILATDPGYSFNNEFTGDVVGPGNNSLRGTHGHLPDPEFMHATFVAAGAGIKPGIVLGRIRNLDVAPTVARLLQIKLPEAEGRVLEECLVSTPATAVAAPRPPYDVVPPAEPPYYRVRYEGSSKPDELVFPVNYTLWIPPGMKELRGVVVHQHGCGEGSCRSGLTGAFDLHWQALARKHGCALLSPTYEQPEQADCQLWCDPRNGSAAAFQKGLSDLGAKSGHPELGEVPWALWGHSGGGHWAGGMVLLRPERVVAAWLRSGVPLLKTDPSKPQVKPHALPEAALKVPTMCNLGTKEGVTVKDTRFAGVWPANEVFFTEVRSKGGLVGVAVDPLSAHECGNQRYLAIPWLDACLAARLPGRRGEPLREMTSDTAWLAEPTGLEAVPAARFAGDPLKAAWLPDPAIARLWTEYVRDTVVTDTTPPPVPTNLRVDGNELTWDAEADLESGLAGFVIERDGQFLANVPDQGKNPFGRPVFQNLQYSDTPTQPLVPMRYTDATAKAGEKHTYRIRSVNTAGLKSEAGK